MVKKTLPITLACDRQLCLSELLPAALMEALFGDLIQTTSISITARNEDGRAYCMLGEVPSGLAAMIDQLSRQQTVSCPRVRQTATHQVEVFALEHELETVGHIAVSCSREQEVLAYSFPALSHFIAKTLQYLLDRNYQYMMTAELHGQVVEDSYAQLKEKADLLEKSERRYRQLAEHLEEEVDKKTREVKETQVQLIQQEKMASIGQLAAGMAHEINNPMGFIYSNLNAMQNYSQTIASLIRSYRDFFDDLNTDVTAAEWRERLLERVEQLRLLAREMEIDFILEDIDALIAESKDGADRIKKIVIDLKEFAQPGESGLKLTDINQCLDSALNIITNEIKYKAIVTKDYGELPPVICRPQQMSQVFMHLLLNAAQAIEEKGEIEVHSAPSDGGVYVRISDTGAGIAEAILPKIYDPFFTTRAVGSGTGLGLNVVYQIIKQHGGTIRAESSVGQGTCFHIHLPLETPAKSGVQTGNI